MSLIAREMRRQAESSPAGVTPRVVRRAAPPQGPRAAHLRRFSRPSNGKRKSHSIAIQITQGEKRRLEAKARAEMADKRNKRAFTSENAQL